MKQWPVTVLTGARQTGKTTLVRDLLPRDEVGRIVYLSLDDPDERLRLAADPVRRLDHGTDLVVLDEIQKQPALLDAVKLLADRDEGHRFLLLGSSQILLLRQIRETLAGRATLLELWPLALVERVTGREVPESGLDRIWKHGESILKRASEAPPSVDTARRWRRIAQDHFHWGGYPRLERFREKDRGIWLRDFRRTYLERDLADLGRVSDLDQFALAQNLLAARTACLLSYSEVSRELGVAVNTVKRYMRFLEISYQISLLRPLATSLTARLVKTPKLYWTDPGLARVLSERMESYNGPLYETAVFNELQRWSTWQPLPPSFYFFRTHGGNEVDFVMYSTDVLIAMEVKSSEKAHRQDTRTLTDIIRKLELSTLKTGATRLGLLVYRGRETALLAPHIWAIPDWQLFGPAP